jgi:hypothetical protein
MAEQCTVEGCKHEAKRGGLCWGHVKRRTRGRPVDVELRQYGDIKQTFKNAVLSVGEVDAFDGEEWTRAWDRVRKAVWAMQKRRIPLPGKMST